MKNIKGKRGSTMGAQAVFLVISFMAVSACTARNADLTWVEAVQLASGETIKIKRHVVFLQERVFGGEFLSAPIYKTSSLELQDASVQFPVWDAPLVPVLLDKDPTSGEWVLVASSDNCEQWIRNGLPRPPYWAFRLRNGTWYRDGIPKSFLGRPANLFVGMRVTDSSAELNDSIEERKRLQVTNPKHARQYNKVDLAPSQFEHCDRRPSKPLGEDEQDLKKFRGLP